MTEESHFRERIVEVLGLFSDPASQIEYQSNAPGVAVPGELFNQWDDWYRPTDPGFLKEFDQSEVAALAQFGRLVDEIVAATPQNLPPLKAFMQTEPWQQLRDGAKGMLHALNTPNIPTP